MRLNSQLVIGEAEFYIASPEVHSNGPVNNIGDWILENQTNRHA